jgi:hypothetical protein
MPSSRQTNTTLVSRLQQNHNVKLDPPAHHHQPTANTAILLVFFFFSNFLFFFKQYHGGQTPTASVSSCELLVLDNLGQLAIGTLVFTAPSASGASSRCRLAGGGRWG